ncbi:hypothetical protein CDD82_2328 [Ophiocordyceps australis]|uniref:Uncharacterized protein n=1 Tax=Ophiocordyceps australis TaxID=1399860 RepID=A0A2C5XZU3_9HYPO|nr:hypothetical protein CDD82_2328 [Ophiocordyceps australis]
MSNITWIIIVLIVVSILVTVTEVGLRFGMLSKKSADQASVAEWSGLASGPPVAAGLPDRARIGPLPHAHRHDVAAAAARDSIEALALVLGLRANATVSDLASTIDELQRLAASCSA